MKRKVNTSNNDNCFSTILLKWYSRHKRDLPWRDTTDPYKVWLSEIILQQTRIEQGLPFYRKFLLSYPSVELLARASLQEVLRLWQGLGYYTRARNLHACAIKIVMEYEMKFPASYHQLIQLPGIGPYTAAAIASFCFNERVLALDGNSIRVLTRYINFEESIDSLASRLRLAKLSAPLVPSETPGLFNQALMDFGAMQCTTPVPSCQTCPLSSSCMAFQTDRQILLPIKEKKIKKKNRYFHYLIFEEKGFIYLKQRIEKDIWHGLFEFFLIETPKSAELQQLHAHNLDELLSGATLIRSSNEYKHLLTHQKLHIRFYTFEIHKETVNKILASSGYQKFIADEIEQLPKPIIIERYLKEKII